MASKYQSVYDKLNQKKKETQIQENSNEHLRNSHYSSVYEKLGKFSSNKERDTSFIEELAKKPILQPATPAERLKADRQIREEVNDRVSPSSRYGFGEQDTVKKALEDFQKLEETAEKPNKENDFNVIDSINYINARGANELAHWNDNLNLFGEKALSAIKAAINSLSGEQAPKLQSYASQMQAMKESNYIDSDKITDKINEKVQTIVKDVDAAQTQVLENAVKNNTFEKRAEETEQKYSHVAANPIVKGIADTVAAIDYMLPTMAANIATNGALSPIIMAEFGANDAYIDARKDGSSISSAKNYAILEGINQGIGDMLIGGLAGTGEGLISKAVNKVTKGAFSKSINKTIGNLVTSPVGRTIIKFFGNALGEGVEESLQSLTTTLNRKLTYDKNAKVNWNDVAYEGLIGSLMGGFFSASNIPANYQAYKLDADIVNSFAKAAEKAQNENDVELIREVGTVLSDRLDETINDKDSSEDIKERAKFVKVGIDSIVNTVNDNASEIITKNETISNAIESIAESPVNKVVETTAQLVDTVADMIEPSEDAVNTTIDIVREKIVNTDDALEKAVLQEIDSTLRNKKQEVVDAIEKLPENNLTVPESETIIDNEVDQSGFDYVFEHVVQKHTKTNEDLHVIKLPERLDKTEYNKIKNQIKKIGGYYSNIQKGFIIPNESVDKIADNLAEIKIGVKTSSASSGEPENVDKESVLTPTKFTLPDGLSATEKTKATRMFNKWAANEYVNISAATPYKANLFASFASKLYEAGYNGVKQIGNYANLTDEEISSFPAFLQDEFYNLGKNAGDSKPSKTSQDSAEMQESATEQEPPQINNNAQEAPATSTVDNTKATISKSIISYFKKSNKNHIVDIEGNEYITNGILLVPINTEADRKIAIEELRGLRSKLPDAAMDSLVNAKALIEKAPIETENLYVFNSPDGKIYFDKKLFKHIDGGLLYYNKFANGAVIKSVNEDGSIKGYLLSILPPKQSISESETPAKLKSFSQKMQNLIKDKLQQSSEVAEDLEKGDNIPDSNITLDKDGEDYSDKHQKVIDEYANAVDDNFIEFIENAIQGKTKPDDAYTLENITPKQAEDIRKLTGVDANGWDLKLESRILIDHIWRRHGENGKANNNLKNTADISRMQYVIDNADYVEPSTPSTAYREKHPYLSGKTRGARTIKYSKKVNGTYYVVEAIPNTEKKTAYIVTAYIEKNRDSAMPDDTSVSPVRTSTSQGDKAPDAALGNSVYDNSIAQTFENVNTPEAKIADFVADRLSKGLKIDSKDLQVIANNAYGGTQSEGAYDVKSMTDAMELGVNKHLLSVISNNQSDFNSNNASDAVDSIKEINEDILAKIPTQTKRSDEQISLQQFSTPPNIAYVAAWAANISDSDVALEPSAGIGGLATFAKAFGAETIVNELSDRRLAILKNMPFDAFYNENAEQIDNILPDSVKPTVVIMNPPFSSTGGRTKNSTKNAIPHIEQALLRLEDNGRLVAIVGRGMADDTATFKNWWNELRKQYNIRANIGINGENYRKYGTSFDVQLVVIDKTGPQTGETITGYYDNLDEIPKILEGVRNDRTRTDQRSGETKQNTPVTDSETLGVESVSVGTRSNTDGSTNGISRSRNSGTARNMEISDGESSRSDRESDIVDRNAEIQPESSVQISDNDGTRGQLDGRDASRSGTEQGSGRMGTWDGGTGTDGQSVGLVQSESGIPGTTVKKQTAKKAAENDDGVYAEYKTVPLTVKGAKKHPAKLVESSAMSAVASPTLTYKPKLDSNLITSGALSDAQLENISYAGQAHTQMLKNGKRKGYFIGDGTGVGKGRQLAGIIMDNWNQGRHKAIWISENKNLSTDARRDWADLGGDPNQIIDWEKAQKSGMSAKEGIIFIPYSSLAGGKTKNRATTTLEALEQWFGKNYDGVIVFDEAHNMGNLIPMKGARGTKKPSQKAIAGDKLQQELPNARITYASATGATNIENLSYASRLGLWGEGTSFRDANDFISKIGRAGIAAMELVARDMKSMGVYLARSISYDGVVYDNIQHKLTSTQRKMYDGMSEGWQIVLQNFDKAMQTTNSENAKDVKQRRGQVYGNMQQFYNQVLTSMAMPTVIKDIEKQLEAGKSCVIQLVNTNEAAQDRAVADAKTEGKTDLDDLDITPRQLLVGYVENAFPINQYEEYIDDNGNIASRLVLDSNGQPVINRQAVRMKEELIAQLNEISIPEGPLDMLLNHFGADQIAEITGRSGRVLTVTDESGNEHKQYVSRDSGKANIAETKDFQDGRKRILVFSGAGSTGRSFHADKRAKNQQQRIHYVLQPGWKAETAVQGFGRTHRSNQVNTPIFRLVSTDVMGHKRFVTSIARRLDQLGALTKGQRQTGSGVFGEKDNLESPLSRQALREFYRRLGNGRIPELDAKSVLGKMGLDKAFYDEYDRFILNENIASDITKFLNRILALPVEEQNEVFTAFEEIRDSMYQQALESGALDIGLENVKADKIEIAQDDVIYTDPATGAETRYVKAKLYTKPKVISTIEDAKAYRNGFVGIYRMENGSARAVYRIADKTDQWGGVVKNYVLISPNTGVQSRYIEPTLKAKTEVVPEAEWESAWAEELAKVPEYNEGERHMITGAILPVWNRLPETDNVKAQRIVAVDGSQYLGRIIQSDMVDSTLRSFDVKAQKSEHTGNSIYNEIFNKNNIVTMRGIYGGTITISKRRVSNENRIEVSGHAAAYLSDKFPGIFTETIQYQKRHFIPTGEKGIDILDKMVKELGVRSVESEDSGAYYSLGTSTGKWGNGDSKAQVMSITELTRQASRIFGVEINTGKIGNKNASGVFKTHAGTIRTRVYGDIPTIAHELGHMFDKKYNLQSSPFIKTVVDSFGTDLKNNGYTEAQFPAESIAEYFREYLSDRVSTENKYKPFTQWLYENISFADSKRLYDYSGMTNAYMAADAERRADAQIHTRVHDNKPIVQAQMQIDTFIRNPQAYSGGLARKFARWFVDDIVDLQGFGKTYDYAMLEKQADSVAIGRLTSAMTDKYNNIVGDSLATILANGSINELNRLAFDKYLVACVALDRITAAETASNGENVSALVYGDEQLQNKDNIIERIATYERENPTFKDTAAQIYGYNRNLLQLAVQSGLMSQDLVDTLNEKFPHYVPLYRVMDDKNPKPTKAKKGYADQKTPIARFKGSGRDIYSPLENIMLNTEKFTKACMRNDVMTEFADYIDFNEDMGWAAEKVTEKKFLDRVSTKEINEKIKSFSSEKLNSLNDLEIEELLSEMVDFVGDYATQWKPTMYQGKNVVSVMRDGQHEYYEIHDADLLKCLNNLNSIQMNVIINALGGATATFKVLTTGSNPVFSVTNIQRDLISGYVSSTTTNDPFKYMKDYAIGLYEAIRQTESYKQYIREGGGYSDAISRDTSRLRKTESQLIKTTNNLKRLTYFVGNTLPKLVEVGESASRYAEYKRAKEQGIAALEAVRLSQEVTVNFARGGTVVKDIDKFIPYFRASVNSMYHLIDVLTTGDKKTKQARWAKFVGVNTIPAIIALAWRAIAAAVFGEDEEKVEESYQTLSAYNKNAYWCYYVGDGNFFRVSKPKDMTVFSTVWERLVEFGFMQDKNALYGLGEYVLDSLCPPTASDSTFIGTAIDLAKNETYTGAPIVTQAYENLAPELQYKEDTSKLAVFLGQLLNVSPMKVDYIIEDNTGFVGQLITNLLRVDGKINLGFANKFVVDSVYSTDEANIFYDKKEMYDSNAASYKHTLGKNDKYSIADIFGSYKYGKIAATYSDLNKWMKVEENADSKRAMKSKMNAFLSAINNTEMSDIDKAVLNIAEITGAEISDIAPYIVVPDEVTYSRSGYKEKFTLSFDEILNYYAESQLVLNGWYMQILESGYSEEMMAEAMIQIKKEIAQQMRDRWEEIKFNQKYN